MSKSKTVFLDARTLDPGDNDLSVLSSFLDIEIYPRTEYKDTIDVCKNAEIIITNKAVIDKTVMDACPDLKLIQVAATGFNNVNGAYARSQGIDVCNISGYSTPSVAQQVFAMLLSYLNSFESYARESREGVWSNSEDFSYWRQPIHELHGQTFGIIGFGTIGEAVARIASSFGMQVIVSVRTPKESTIPNLEFHDQDYVLRNSDVLSLHAPLNASTEDLINKESLSIMKKNCILINTARGPMIVEEDLAEALKNGEIQAALLDVLRQEPPEKNNPLFHLQNCYISPHQAWASLQARQRLLDLMVHNLKSYLKGELLNCVNL